MGDSTESNELQIQFKINEQIFTLFELVDGSEHLFKLTNDDVYTTNYLIQLINNGFISLDQPLNSISRVEYDGIERPIYPRLILSDIDEPASEQENTLETRGESQSDNNENKEICIWTDAETRFLLDLYEQYMARVGPMKQFKTKKSMWIKLSETVNKKFKTFKTALQCENRYKTVLKRKKTAVENNSRSGNSREVIPFEEELCKIASADDSIEPEVTGTVNSIKILKTHRNDEHTEHNDSSPSASSSTVSELKSISTPKRKRTMTVQETLLEIYERKEVARERRHKDKMDLIQKLVGTNINNKEGNDTIAVMNKSSNF